MDKEMLLQPFSNATMKSDSATMSHGSAVTLVVKQVVSLLLLARAILHNYVSIKYIASL